MLKFFKKHPPKEGEERERLKKELFKFQKCVDHGFPSKPSALAYDPKLQLLAIGTKSGALRVYGTPGFEVSAVHAGDIAVTNLFFIPEEGYLISTCSDNSLHFWEINSRNGTSVLEERKFESADPIKVENMSACCLSNDFTTLYIGTQGGNIHVINAKSLTETSVINLDSIIQNIPDELKVGLGAVEALVNCPASHDKLLIGFNKGLIMLWNIEKSTSECFFNSSLQLESLAWRRNGEEFISAHSDGSFIIWNASPPTGRKEPPACPYGPFPCKAINKIEWKVTKNGLMTVFSGGMPRASYGDRHTVAIIHGDNHVVADLTSRVVDFLIISKADEKDAIDTGRDDPQALIILAEEELVVLDLEDESLPCFRLPYLNTIHTSVITCTYHVSNVPDQLWQKIMDAGESQNKNFSKRDWPINGGKNLAAPSVTKALLLTGHEDGTVRFWDASTSCLRLMYKLSTCPLFGIPDHVASPEEEEWPPFRKVGTFDPYSDDPRLAIQKLALCVLSETLVIAGSAGQVLIFKMDKQESEQDITEVKVNIMGDHDGFVWKGHEALTCKTGDFKYTAGFQPTCLMQLDPPACCTALAIHTEWQLVAAGTGQGFALLDYAQKKEVATRCTLNPTDLIGAIDAAVTRGRNLRKSIRESFRRLRRKRSDKRPKAEESKTDTQHIEETQAEATSPEATSTAAPEVPAPEAPETAAPAETAASAQPAAEEASTELTAEPTSTEATEGAASTEMAASSGAATGTGDSKPEEQLTEPRIVQDSVTTAVRSLYFADTFIINGGGSNPSLWVGTSGGNIYVYSLTIPAAEKRSEEQVECILVKEVKLKHQAPVLGMAVIDSKNIVLPDAFEVANERAKAPDMEGQHSVIICSEEQLKTFSLPTLRPRWKNKIFAADGSRVRKLNFATFRREGDGYNESDIACALSNGEVRVYSVATLRKQLSSQLLQKEDTNGISSFVFTKDGQGFYLQSPSEFSHVTLSASPAAASIKCELELAEGLRPKPEPKAEEAAAEGGLVRQPTVEVTPASEEQSQEVPGEADITIPNAEMDTSVMSTDITIDSVRDVLAEAENTIVTSVRTITKTTTSTVTENVASAGQEAQRAFAATNGLVEELQDGVTDILRETQREVTTRTSEFVTRTSEKVTHAGEEVVKQLSELKMTTAVIEDPALLKQKLVDTIVTTTTTSGGSTATSNGE